MALRAYRLPEFPPLDGTSAARTGARRGGGQPRGGVGAACAGSCTAPDEDRRLAPPHFGWPLGGPSRTPAPSAAGAGPLSSNFDGGALEPCPAVSPRPRALAAFLRGDARLGRLPGVGPGARARRSSSSSVAGSLRSRVSVRPASGAVRLFLQVRDMRAVRERLASRGVPIEQEPAVRPWGLFEMVVRDPDGLALVFVEVPPDHPLRRRG